MNFTPAQCDAAWETDRHVLVAAGAGTGKTRTVIGRILYLLGAEVEGQRIADPLPLREIAAITFTNHAAADLKAKLRRALHDAGLSRDAYLVDTARIGTIHGFCSEVLKEFALRTGGNPRELVLDEIDRSALVSEVVRDTLLEAIDDGRVEHLPQLFAEWSIRDVTRFVAILLNDLDRLRTVRAHRHELEHRERALIDLADRAVDRLDRRLLERGAIDFDRIIVRARDLLRSDAQTLNALRRRVRVLIVDEFQDVDPAQKEIAYLLGDPRSSRPDTPRLLLVGDPQQSIYRFRRADITVWREVERDFVDCGRVIVLHDNFRSTPAILGFVDATVGRILEMPVDGEAHRGYEARFESLTAATEQVATIPVELLVVPTREDGRDYLVRPLREIEAAAVARRARDLADAGEATWGQMAVIMPTWGLLSLYQEAFDAVGASAYPLRTAGFYEQREIVDLIMALETIRNPTDDRALLGFLRSPFVGVADETLLEVARQSSPPYWTALPDVEVKERSLVEQGVAVIRRHAAMRDRVPIDELLDSLLDETGYLAHLRLQGAARAQAIANVSKFLRLTRAASRSGVGEFLRMVREARAREGEEGEVPLVPRKDALTITTVHSAKGLEWDVVFWADLIRRASGGEDRDLLVGRHHIALKDPERESKDQPAYWLSVKEDIDREAYAERKRLWYVAATRAAKRLIVSGLPAGAMAKGGTQTGAHHLWSALGSVPLTDGAAFDYASAAGVAYTGIVRIADPAVPPSPSAPQVPEAVAATNSLAPPRRPIRVRADRPRHSASELLLYDRCQQKHWFTYVLGVREPEVDRTTTAFIDAAARGHIVHEVLYRLHEADELDELLEDAIGRWDPTAPPPEAPRGIKYRAHLRREITQVAHHPAYREVADLPTAARELGFLHIADTETVYQGEIDLAAAGEDGLILLDVKTTRGDAQAVRQQAARFRPQRDVYVTAAEGISGIPVTRFAFQFSGAGVQVNDDLVGGERAGMQRALGEVVASIGASAPRLTDHPAECRFCGFKDVGWCPGVSQAPLQDGGSAAQLRLNL